MDLGASPFALFEVTFASSYLIWGINFFVAILLPNVTGSMTGIMWPVLSLLFSGVKPSATDLMPGFGGYMSLCYLASPIRWCMTFMLKTITLTPSCPWYQPTPREIFE